MHLENANIDFIRPFLLVHEKDIKTFIKEENIYVMGSSCPADKTTTREDVKTLLNNLYHQFPKAKESFLDMISNYEQEDLWGNEIYYQINNDGLCLKPVVKPIDQWHVINIRQIVFRDEQGVSYYEDEILEEELESKTYLLYKDNKTIGTLRYRIVNGEYKIERFAILKEYRGKGYGLQTLNYLVDMLAKEFNPCTITLNGQEKVIEFYKKGGFTPIGDMFQEAGINHVKMIKVIK